MGMQVDRYDNGDAQFILYSDGDIRPPTEPGKRSRHEFIVYVTRESLVSAQVDSGGMVEVTVREGRQIYEEFGDGHWILWHREYRAKFPYAFLARRGLEAGYSQLFPHLSDLYQKPSVQLSADLVVDIEVSDAPLTPSEFRDGIHRFRDKSEYWSEEHLAYYLSRFVDVDRGECGPVKLAFVHLAHDYLEQDGYARFAYDKSIEYAAHKRTGIKRQATVREVLAFSKRYDVDQFASVMALGTSVQNWDSVKRSHITQYPRMIFQGHVRSLDFLRDDTGYGGRGEMYLAVVV